MKLSFVFPHDAPGYYNGNTITNMYTESVDMNSGSAFIAQNQGVVAPQHNYNAFAASSQSATLSANYNVIAD